MAQEISFDNSCTPYVTNDYSERLPPCQCPVCSGFLPYDIFQDPLICKKCGSELIAIEASEKLKDSDDWEGEEGHICVVTRRTKTKLQTREERAVNRAVREGAKKWKGIL